MQKEDNIKDFIRENPKEILKVKYQTDELCEIAINEDINLLPYIKNQTENICMIALHKDADAIRYVKNQTENLCTYAISKNPFTIKYIRTQTEKICKDAILISKKKDIEQIFKYIKIRTKKIDDLLLRKDPTLIRYFKDKDEDAYWNVLNEDIFCIKYIENPTPLMIDTAIKQSPRTIRYIKNQTEEVCEQAIQNSNSGNVLELLNYIKNPTQKIYEIAVSKNGEAIKYIENKTTEISKIAIDNCEYLINILDYLDLDNKEIIKYLINKYSGIIRYIDESKLDESSYKLSIENNVSNFYLINNQTEDLCLCALEKAEEEQVHDIFEDIENQTEKICLLALNKIKVDKVLELYFLMKLRSFNIYKAIIDKYKNYYGRYEKNNKEEVTIIFNSIENKRADIKKIFLEYDVSLIQYIDNPSEEDKKIVLNKNGMALEFVENQTEDLCVIALSQNGMALEFVEKQTEELCAIALDQNGMALKFVESQTENLCLLALNNSKDKYDYDIVLIFSSIKNKTIEMMNILINKLKNHINIKIEDIVELCSYLDFNNTFIGEEFLKIIVENKVTNYYSSKNDDYMYDCMKDILLKIEKPPVEVYKIVLQERGKLLEFIENQTEELCMIALENNVESFSFIRNKTEKLCKYALEHNPLLIKYIENQTEELCILALETYQVQGDKNKNRRFTKEREEKYWKSDFYNICSMITNLNRKILDIIVDKINNYEDLKQVFKQIKNRNNDIDLIFLKKDVRIIKYIKHIKREFSEKIIYNHPYVLNRIDNLDARLGILALRGINELERIKEECYIEKSSKDRFDINFYYNFYHDFNKEKFMSNILKIIKNPTIELYKEAVMFYPKLAKRIKTITNDFKKYMISVDPRNIYYIEEQNYEICMFALKESKHKNTDEIMLSVVQSLRYSDNIIIDYIKNIDAELLYQIGINHIMEEEYHKKSNELGQSFTIKSEAEEEALYEWRERKLGKYIRFFAFNDFLEENQFDKGINIFEYYNKLLLIPMKLDIDYEKEMIFDSNIY